MDLEIKRVTFEFEDGTLKTLEGDELEQWEVICSHHSDYLLPAAPGDILATWFHALSGSHIRGFMPAMAVHHA